jgi:hypothetical protein
VNTPEKASDVQPPDLLKGLQVLDHRTGKVGVVVDILPSASVEVHWEQGGFDFVPSADLFHLSIRW